MTYLTREQEVALKKSFSPESKVIPLKPLSSLAKKPEPIEEKPMTPEELEDMEKEVRKQKDMQNARIIACALMESAIRYRQVFIREDIEQFANVEWDLFKKNPKINAPGWARKEEPRVKARILAYQQKLEAIDDAMEKEVKTITSVMKPGFAEKFDNYATAYGVVAEELAKARNTTHFGVACKLYNMGFFDEAIGIAVAEEKKLNDQFEITDTKNQTDENKTSNSDDHRPVGDSDNGPSDGVPEKKSDDTDAANYGVEAISVDSDGYVEGGSVENDLSDAEHRDDEHHFPDAEI